MKTALIIFLLLSLAGFGFSLKCAVCVDQSCEGQSVTLQCPELGGVAAACTTYKNPLGLLTKSCSSKTFCDGTLVIPGNTEIECCYSDMCNSSAKLGMNIAIVFCLVLLKLFL